MNQNKLTISSGPFTFSRTLMNDLKQMHGIHIKTELINFILFETKERLQNDNNQIDDFIYERWW
jgi:hypothetical protein